MGMVVSVSQGSSGQLWRRNLEDEGVGERGVQWLACLARGLLRRTDTSLPVTSSMATLSYGRNLASWSVLWISEGEV